MANKLLHTKQTNSKISNHFFASNVGNETEINIISMASKGQYLTAKAGGQWHSVKLKPAQKVDDGDFINLTVSGDALFEKGSVLFKKGWTSTGDVFIRGTQKLYFEAGSTANTYMTADADSLSVYAGSDLIASFTAEDSNYLELPDGVDLVIHLADKIRLDGDEAGDTYIATSTSDELDFYIGGTNILKISEAATNSFNINSTDVTIDATKKLLFDGSILGHTYITESSADVLDFYVGAKKMLALDEANDKITLAAGNYVAAIADGTEFSALNSAYAGMILAYTCVGADVADDSYTLTTSYVCFDDSGGTPIRVSFVTPPSEYVEIEVELYFSAGSSNKQLRLSLSDNAAYGSNTLAHPNQFEKVVSTPARGNGGTFTQKWLLGDGHLAAIGSVNAIFIAASTDSTTGTPIIKWGGDASGEYTNLVMKAVALPAAIVEGSP